MDSQARRLAPSVGPHFLTEFARVAHTSQDVPASHVSVQAGQSNVSNARLRFAGARICGVVKALSRGLPRQTVTVVVGQWRWVGCHGMLQAKTELLGVARYTCV